MLISGILNPHVLALLARVRHTNALVIADWAFPSWPGLETVDLSLVGGIPSLPDVVSALLANWKCGQAYMAAEFKAVNPAPVRRQFARLLRGVPLTYEPHLDFKRRVPSAIGLIRTGSDIPYSNLILISG